MSEAFHLYVISFTVGAESGLALVAAQDEKSAFQILKNGGSRHCDGYSLIQTRDIGMTTSCHYGLLLESFVNAIEAFDAITQAANKLVGPPGVTSATAEIGPDTQEGPKVTLTMHGTELSFVFQNIDGGLQTLPIASDTTLGGVKIGSGLSIDGEGVLSSSGGGGSDPNAVKYTEQTLTTLQKAQARTNIGACGSAPVSPSQDVIDLYPTVNYTAQSLTTEQKAQARTNIGAGTSDFSGDYRDLSNKPTIPEPTTISTDVKTDKNTNAKAAGAKAVYDEVHPPVATVRYSWGMSPNVFYNLGELSGNIIFLFATPDDINIVNHYYFCFDTGSTPPTITWPVEITDWFGVAAPTIVANHHYEISVINGVAAYLEV